MFNLKNKPRNPTKNTQRCYSFQEFQKGLVWLT